MPGSKREGSKDADPRAPRRSLPVDTAASGSASGADGTEEDHHSPAHVNIGIRPGSAETDTSAMPGDEDDVLGSFETIPSPHQETVAFVDSSSFSIVMGCIVMLNVLSIGLETDLSGDAQEVFAISNGAFLLIYIAELTARFLTHGAAALLDRLTLLDIILVMLAFMEGMISSSGFARSLPTFRLLRLFRLGRTMRAIKYSKDLRVLAYGAQNMMCTLLWVTLILVLILWALAAVATKVIGESGEFNGSWDPSVDNGPFTKFDSREYFGNVYRSFLTLVQVLTLSHWAEDVARPIVKVYPASFLFFAFFLLVTTYGLLATVVSNLVLDSIIAARNLEKALKEVHRENRRLAGNRAMELIKMVDRNRDGTLSDQEIGKALQLKEFRKLLIEMEVPLLDAKEFVLGFDTNGDGVIGYEELRDGLAQMDEEITPKDYTKLAVRIWSIQQRIMRLEERLESMANSVIMLRKKMEVAFKAIRHHLYTRDSEALQRRALDYVRNSVPTGPKLITDTPIPTPRDPLAMDDATAWKQFAARWVTEVHPESKDWLAKQELRSKRKGRSLSAPKKRSVVLHDMKPPGEVPEEMSPEQAQQELSGVGAMGPMHEAMECWLKDRWATRTGDQRMRSTARARTPADKMEPPHVPVPEFSPTGKRVRWQPIDPPSYKAATDVRERFRRDVLPEAPPPYHEAVYHASYEEDQRRDDESRFRFDPRDVTPDIRNLNSYLHETLR